MNELTCVLIAFGSFITAGYVAYVSITHGDGVVFGAFIAGISSILTLAIKEIHSQYKNKKLNNVDIDMVK